MFFKSSDGLFDNQYPVRQVTDRLKSNVLLSQVSLWAGLVFLLVGMIFLYCTIPRMNWFDGPDKDTVTGKLLSIAYGGYEVNEVRYYQYSYTYTLHGKEYVGSSYDVANDRKEGDTITIAYDKDQPALSRIKGMRMQPIDVWILIPCVLCVLVGLGALYYAKRQFTIDLFFIRHGIKAESMLHAIKEVDDGESSSYDVSIVYTTRQKEEIKTIVNINDLKNIEAGKPAKVIYLPWDPQQVIFYRHLSEEEKEVINKTPLSA